MKIKNNSAKFSGAFLALAFFGFLAVGLASADNSSQAGQPAQAQGDNPETIEIKNVIIKPAGNNLEVSADLFNPSANVETAPFAKLFLLETINPLINPAEEDNFIPPPLISSAQEESSYLKLKPLEKIRLQYIFPINQYLPRSNYNFSIFAISKNGQLLGQYKEAIFDIGSNDSKEGLYKNGFIGFDEQSCKIISQTGEEYGNNEGPIFKPGESPKISCLVKNVGKENLIIYPKVEWKEYFVYGRPSSGSRMSEKFDKSISLKAQESKTVEFYLPKAQKPQVYQALLSFVDAENNKRSFEMPFRWTITGSSARIENVSLQGSLKNSYDKGETVSLAVGYFGSMDLYWKGIESRVKNLDNLKLLATIKDGSGSVCGQKEETLNDVSDSKIKNKIINIVLDKECSRISYEASLFSNGQELASESEEFPALKSDNSTKASAYYLYAMLLAIIATLIYYFASKGKKAKLSVFVFIILGSSFFYSLAMAYNTSYKPSASSRVITYPDDNGKIINSNSQINRATVAGGTVSSFNWGGSWKGNSLFLLAGPGSVSGTSVNRAGILRVDSAKADFTNYFNNSGKKSIRFDTSVDSAFDGCGNESMYFRKAAFFEYGSGGARTQVKIRPWGYTGPRFYGHLVTESSQNVGLSGVSLSFEIDTSDMPVFYNNGVLKNNPRLAMEYSMAFIHSSKWDHGYPSSIIDPGERYVTGMGRNNWDAVLNPSDIIKIAIPLNLPGSGSSSSSSNSSTSSLGAASNSSSSNSPVPSSSSSSNSSSNSSMPVITGGGGGSFTLSASPQIITATIIENDSDVSDISTITINPSAGFNDAVGLSATSSPFAVTFSDSNLDNNEYSLGSLFTVQVPGSTSSGDYPMVITGKTPNGLEAQTTITLKVKKFDTDNIEI